ncbi:MAG: hypothetical protein V3U28_10325 [Candidatus Acidoferrales bacterium]
MTAEHTPPPRHEQRDINFRYVALFFLSLFLLLGLALGAMAGLFRTFSAWQQAGQLPAPPMAQVRPGQPPAPRLQVNPGQELEAFRQVEEERLSSYGWVDAEAGVIHIPIERALELLAERGLPVRPPSGGARKSQSEEGKE